MSENGGAQSRAPGWVTIGIDSVGVMVGMVLVYGLGVMLPSMITELDFGLVEAGALSASGWLTGALLGVPVAAWVSGLPPKRTIGVLRAIFAAALLLSAWAPNYPLLLGARAIAVLSSMAVGSSLAVLQTQWFASRQMGRVQSIHTGFMALGQAMALALVPAAMLVLGGWRQTYVATALAVVAVLAAWVLFARERVTPEYAARAETQRNAGSPLRQALRYREFILLGIGLGSPTITKVAFATFWPKYAVDTLGLPLTTTGQILGLLPLTGMVSALLAGAFSDRLGLRKPPLVVAGLALVLGYFSLLQFQSPVALGLAAAFTGFFALAIWPVGIAVAFELPGIQPRAVAVGVAIINAIMNLCGAVGGQAGGLLGEYLGIRAALTILCLSPLLLVISVLFCRETGPRSVKKGRYGCRKRGIIGRLRGTVAAHRGADLACIEEDQAVAQAKRVAVIGFDCAITSLIDKHIAEGYLPTFKKVFEGGVVADYCLVPYPTITPPNWATIGTGALIGTHGVTDFWMPLPDKPLDSMNITQAFDSGRVKAEFAWDAADKAGKKCVVLNFPGSWPSHMKNGIMVGGAALTPIESKEGFRLTSANYLCGNQLITNGFYPQSIRAKFEPAEGWANLADPGEEPLEMTAPLAFPDSAEDPAPATWYVLVRQSKGEGYDTVTLATARDMQSAFFTLKNNEWSPKIYTTIAMKDGSAREVYFRAKVVALTEDADDFRLFVTALCDQAPLTSPAEAAARIVSPEAVPVPEAGMVETMLQMVGYDTYVECAALYTQYLTDVATSFLKDGDWDVFYMHSHPPDFTYHLLMTALEPLAGGDEKKRAQAWEIHRQIYQLQDDLLRDIMALLPEDTMVVLVSDHGAAADGPMIDWYSVFGQKGLMTLVTDEREMTMEEKVWAKLGFHASQFDRSKTRAIPHRSCYVYVNLKGREEGGIVEPADYGKTQQEIIDALYSYVDPGTGKRPVALALTKEDARLLGLYGDNVGDVVYAMYPWFGGQHGQALPTARWGIGDLRGLWAMYGPGIKKGVRLQRTVGLEDIVPTTSYATGLPLPKDVDGAVVFQVFEDPEFRQKEMAELSDALAKAEAELSGGQE